MIDELESFLNTPLVKTQQLLTEYEDEGVDIGSPCSGTQDHHDKDLELGMTKEQIIDENAKNDTKLQTDVLRQSRYQTGHRHHRRRHSRLVPKPNQHKYTHVILGYF